MGHPNNRQREECHRASWRARHHRVRGNLDVGQSVWLWSIKTVTLRDSSSLGGGIREFQWTNFQGRFGRLKVQLVEFGFDIHICCDLIGDTLG